MPVSVRAVTRNGSSRIGQRASTQGPSLPAAGNELVMPPKIGKMGGNGSYCESSLMFCGKMGTNAWGQQLEIIAPPPPPPPLSNNTSVRTVLIWNLMDEVPGSRTTV